MSDRKIQRLIKNAPRGQPLDPAMLRSFDISPAQTTYLVSAGWLQRLSKGAYLVTGDVASVEGIITYLSRRIPGLHVGGKTALDWQGARHNVAFRPKITLWGSKAYRFPAWIERQMPYTFQTTQLFNDKYPVTQWFRPLPFKNEHVLVSVPELALLELTSDIGKRGRKGQSLDEAVQLTDTLRNLRIDVLIPLLENCVRVKVVKLVRDLGQSSGYAWGEDLQKYVNRLSQGKRWSSKGTNGRRLTLKP
ncbi:type IV toxin-antitoxin system AbiEi family antitoxin domain-containing protein [Paraburkholderia sartisoli]|uniref:Transcriptional regulator with AbiEi antitoxin N-terminal domain n=1 Tax=Paraburkholderia sartisoli TaxID=83784 RepID=A0A1H4GS09_9BURK|nr:type IV toxin-antitoxin system AbiEi family antitoxin domain-containing protein [Paraburkholderia sartisoli]SEB12365.1 transcriptional regulator with AbiEi antitoxin N-terminal domain [Paraburkholderia sartisoli]